MAPELDLATLRFMRRVQQTALAKRLGVTQATLSHWEHGNRSIPLEYAVEIAKALTEATPDKPVTTDDIYAAWQISKQMSAKRRGESDPPDLGKVA